MNTTGTFNLAIGYQSLKSNTEGFGNISIGSSALLNNIVGINNIALGTNTLSSNANGYSNIAVGHDSLTQNTDGYENTAVGQSALTVNSTGDHNTAIGSGALFWNTVGTFNTATGYHALFGNDTGLENTAFGNNALAFNQTGNYNTALGSYAGYNTEYNGTTCLGYNAAVTNDNQVQLGNSGTTTYVYGTVQNRSDLRDKADVRDTLLGLNFINSLRPVDYKWDMREDYRSEMPVKPLLPTTATVEEIKASDDTHKVVVAAYIEANKLANLTNDGSKKRSRYHHGLIAQEVQQVIETTAIDFGGFQDHAASGGEDVMSIGYDELIAPLIKAVQELSAKVIQLETQLANK
jgi:hypothetical protein